MRTALLVAGKDLRLRLRDRSIVLVALVVPLGLAWIFSLILGDIADEDLRMDNIAQAADLDQARSFVASEQARAALVVGEDEIEVVVDTSAPTAGRVAEAIAQGIAAEITYTRVAVGTVLSAGGAANPQELAQQAGAAPWPVEVRLSHAAEAELDPTTYLSAGMAVFFLFFAVQAGVTGIMEERQNGTLARLLSAPVPRSSVYAGKLLTGLVIGLLSMTALVVATTLLLDARWGNPGGVALLVGAGVLAALAIQALIGTVARTAEQAGIAQSIVAIVLGMVGGAFFQVTFGPALLARLSLVTPHAWFLRGLGELRAGDSAAAVLTEAGVLLAFAVVTGAVALVRLRRMARL